METQRTKHVAPDKGRRVVQCMIKMGRANRWLARRMSWALPSPLMTANTARNADFNALLRRIGGNVDNTSVAEPLLFEKTP
eukprot:738716-Lingulodinium_polyedra.AAC.1